jgi:hypothetical protein
MNMLACLQKMKYYASMDITEFASMGGKARAESMSPEQRSEQARRAALVMWEKRRAYADLTERGKRAARSLAKRRMVKMTPAQRSEVARNAVNARWKLYRDRKAAAGKPRARKAA